MKKERRKGFGIVVIIPLSNLDALFGSADYFILRVVSNFELNSYEVIIVNFLQAENSFFIAFTFCGFFM